MKSIILALFIAQLALGHPPTEKSSEEFDWNDKVIEVIKNCKTKLCTKEQTFDQLRTLIDGILKDIKLGTLHHEDCAKEYEELSARLDKDDVINKTDLLEFFKSIETKYHEKFMITTTTTKKP